MYAAKSICHNRLKVFEHIEHFFIGDESRVSDGATIGCNNMNYLCGKVLGDNVGGCLWQHDGTEGSSSSMVEDCFFVLRKCGERAVATHNIQVSQILPCVSYRSYLPYLHSLVQLWFILYCGCSLHISRCLSVNQQPGGKCTPVLM